MTDKIIFSFVEIEHEGEHVFTLRGAPVTPAMAVLGITGMIARPCGCCYDAITDKGKIALPAPLADWLIDTPDGAVTLVC